MSKITIHNFVGTRTRFQRLRDAKLFSGWIEAYSGSTVDLSTNTKYDLQIGDQFRVEGYGHRVTMVASGKLVEIVKLAQVLDGKELKIIESKRALLRIEVSGSPRYASSVESVRLKAPSVPVLFEQHGREFHGFCIDAGLNGFSFTTSSVVEVNEEIVAQVQTNHGVIVCSGNVRYCRLDRDREGMNRCGIYLHPFDRIRGTRWEAFLNSLE